MRLALFGHGRMGTLVEDRASDNGHSVGEVVTSADAGRSAEELADRLRDHDAAIDFSVGSAVLRNATACSLASVPLVEGTTGWRDQEPAVRRVIEEGGGAIVVGENFSVGANLFFRLATHAAQLVAATDLYDAFIEEAHHAKKRDAPSGTALRLRDLLRSQLEREPPVASTRAGSIPGTHRVGFDSEADQILLTHCVRTRSGFVAGALLAARWIQGKRGVFGFADVLNDMLGGETIR